MWRKAGVPLRASGLSEGSWGEFQGVGVSGVFLPRSLEAIWSSLFLDKYSSQFGGGSQYAYFHEEDETSFQLVDTARTQKTAYQRNRMRFAQVMLVFRNSLKGEIERYRITLSLKCPLFFFPAFPQRNLRRDKDRRNMLQFSMQTLPKSAKQKER